MRIQNNLTPATPRHYTWHPTTNENKYQ